MVQRPPYIRCCCFRSNCRGERINVDDKLHAYCFVMAHCHVDDVTI